MKLLKNKNFNTTVLVILSAFLTSVYTTTFVKPAGILSGGFMGIAILVEMVGGLFNIGIDAAFVLILLNAPLALFCAKKISPRFVFFSIANVFLTSAMLNIVPAFNLDLDPILCVIFGGFVSGMSVVTALKGYASTGGTDFIALYVSNKSGKEIWMQVFCCNALMLIIFGFIFGFEKAGYSILFQFVSTKTVSTFHIRYKRVVLQIFTNKKEEILEGYFSRCMHGITAVDGIGGYSKKPVSMLTAIVSSYEVDELIDAMIQMDPNVIVNVTKSEKYVGRFYTSPIE